MADILISIKPKYARLILDRKKRVELRRRGSSIQPGDRLVIYSSSPESSVVGTCMVQGVIVEKPRCLYRRVGADTCLSRKQFHAYLEGTARGVAIEVRKVKELSNPVTLSRLRDRVRGFGVPQSYRFLRGSEIQALKPDGL